MLGNFLDRVFGEHTEATAHDPAENQLLLNNQKRQGEEYPALFPLGAPSSDQLRPAPTSSFSLLLRSPPEQSLR